jgi:hypothetical protein
MASLGSRGWPPLNRVDHLPLTCGSPPSGRVGHLPRIVWKASQITLITSFESYGWPPLDHMDHLPRDHLPWIVTDRVDGLPWIVWMASLGSRGWPPLDHVDGFPWMDSLGERGLPPSERVDCLPRPSKQPLMVRTFLKVYMELSS